MNIARYLFVIAMMVFLPAHVDAAEKTIVKLDVYPPDIHLSNQQDRQSLLVVATRTDGVTEDVTTHVQLSLANDELVRIAEFDLHPIADGVTTLRVAYDGHTVEVPVTVKDAALDRPISFELDVMPVFMRAGCNAGSCHGAARGKDGFRLSLFGYDPDGDYQRLTHEISFRRLNLAIPEESLLLEKATGAVPHTGGKKFGADSEHYATLLRWIELGAPQDPTTTPTCTAIELYPPQGVLEGKGTTQRFIVRAKYSDGTDRDVTTLAVFLTSNDHSMAISPAGIGSSAARGEALVMARFDKHTVGSQMLVLPDNLQYSSPSFQATNYIDELVNAKLDRVRVLPSGTCSDEVILRRATIDITGLLPTLDEYTTFMADTASDKRNTLVDRLLARKEFAEIWAMKWANLLLIRSNGNDVSYKSVFLYSNWLTSQIAGNTPLDQIAKELLTARGGTFGNPATNFFQVERDTLKTSENVAQIFLGIRLQCAQCHNHPFDRWTMDDYYGFAAFFSQVARKDSVDYRERIVFDSGVGEIMHPVNGRAMAPKLLGSAQPDTSGRDRREILADWLASPQNPYFATSAANRVWHHFFGIGIVEPVDDNRVSNPPSNPELLRALGDRLTAYRYDFKRLVRDICASQAYQRATRRNPSNAHDENNFARARVRRIPAENLLDCLSQVTGTKDKFQGLPLGARATQIADGATTNYFLSTFGRSSRTTVCACEATDPTLSQALHLINGETIDRKIRDGRVIESWIDAGQTPSSIIEQLYLICLTRKATADEVRSLVALVSSADDQKAAFHDIFWALLNSREFLFNH